MLGGQRPFVPGEYVGEQTIRLCVVPRRRLVHGRVDGTFEGVTQTLSRGIHVDFSKNISEEAAIAVAEGEQTAAPSDDLPKAELVVHARGGREGASRDDGGGGGYARSVGIP